MDEKTLQTFTALAEKLGITAEYLWSVLLKQAPITGVIDLALAIAWFVGAWLWFRFVQKKTTVSTIAKNSRHSEPEWNDDIGRILAWVSVLVMVVFAAIAISVNLSMIVAALTNPEYWALKQILK